jgi:leader peptidase (prepilin peptidase)/N-methyltransferase
MTVVATVTAVLVALLTAVLAQRLLPVLVADEAGMRLLRPARRSRARARWGAALSVLTAVVPAACAALVLPTVGIAPTILLAVGWGAAAGATPLLVVVDRRIRRLPDRIVLPLIGLTALLWLIVRAAAHEAPAGSAAGLALLLGPVCGAVLLLLSVVGGRGRHLAIGLGDVKLAVLLGLLAGLAGGGGVLAAFVVSQAAALGEALWRVVVRREGLRTRLALGPHLLLGMWTGPVLVTAHG